MKKQDPSNYRAMSEPHEDPQAANDAMNAFLDDVAALRKTHRIPDVAIVVQLNVMHENGVEGELIATAHLGDTGKEVQMFAYALGFARSQRDAALAKLVAGKR